VSTHNGSFDEDPDGDPRREADRGLAPDELPPRVPVAWIAGGLSAALLASLVAIGVLLWRAAPSELSGSMPDVRAGVHLLPVARELPEFHLRDQSGEPFERSRLEGRWSLLFFGYTSCPDVCPTTLQSLAQIKPELEAAGDVQVVFVSVDPARDPVERLREYVGFFDPSFEGVTGSKEEIDGLTGELGVYYAVRAPESDQPADAGYLVDHASSLFLIDPEARLHALLDDPRDGAAFVERLRRAQAVRRGSS